MRKFIQASIIVLFICNSLLVQGSTCFEDVPDDYWAKEYIDLVTSPRFINDARTFEPEGTLTRAEAVKVVIQTFSFKIQQYDVSFIDVDSSDWFADYAYTAESIGIICVDTDNKFNPYNLITREELVTIVMRAFEKAKGTQLYINNNITFNISDAKDISDWAVNYVKIAYEIGIVLGKSEREFDAKSYAARAQVTAVLVRALRALQDGIHNVIVTEKSEGAIISEYGEMNWIPDIKVINEFEEKLIPYVNNYNDLTRVPGDGSGLQYVKDNLKKYKRQYIGEYKDGKMILYCNFLLIDESKPYYSDWRKRYIDVCDGGPNFFQVSYDIQKKELFDLSINGVA